MSRPRAAEYRAVTRGRELLAIWTGVLGAPFIFLVHLQVGYMLVPVDCDLGTRLWVHLASVAGILLAAAAGLLALRTWRRRGEGWPDASASLLSRDRFLGVVGVLLTVLTILTLVAQWIPVFFVDPCR